MTLQNQNLRKRKSDYHEKAFTHSKGQNERLYNLKDLLPHYDVCSNVVVIMHPYNLIMQNLLLYIRGEIQTM